MSIKKENNNKLIIISSPSGAGKTTICKLLLKRINNIDLSISYTTRPKRLNEKNGKDYYFVNHDKFIKLKKQNLFVETAKNFNHYYGSPYTNIKKSFLKNKSILFDIDWKGAKKLRSKYSKNQIIDFFILPPNKKELKRRLEKRGSNNNKEIQIRLSYALTEINHHVDYKYVLINDKINQTVKSLIDIINYNFLVTSINDKVVKKLKFFK
jgi:guanylate kinase